MATKTNKHLLEEIIQRLDVIDQRLSLFEQTIDNLRPVQPNLTNLPPPMFFSTEETNDYDSFVEFINRIFDKEFGQ